MDGVGALWRDFENMVLSVGQLQIHKLVWHWLRLLMTMSLAIRLYGVSPPVLTGHTACASTDMTERSCQQ